MSLAVIRRLFDAPRVIVLVATIGIAQLSLAILSAYPEIDGAGVRFPVPIKAVHDVAGIHVLGSLRAHELHRQRESAVHFSFARCAELVDHHASDRWMRTAVCPVVLDDEMSLDQCVSDRRRA